MFAFVDGANVAYFGHPNVHYSQIRLVVDELNRMGETPLVIMPEKYVARKFRLSYGYVQELSSTEYEIMQGYVVFWCQPSADGTYVIKNFGSKKVSNQKDFVVSLYFDVL